MRKLIVFLILVVFLSSCSKRTPEVLDTTPTVLTDSDIVSAITDLGVKPRFGFIIPDITYMLPSEEWFRDKFPSILWGFQKDLKATFYVTEENDCDNFAKLAAGFAQVLHHNTKEKVTKTSIAIGEIHYYSETLKAMHAINFALVRGKTNELKVLFLEPQKCKIINLTEYEKSTCRNLVL